MAKQKFYAVKVGRVPGIYTSWDDCKKQVDGFSGAKYKSFKLRNEAEAYLSSSSNDQSEKNEKSYVEAIAYVDGSYDDSKKAFAYGGVIFWNDHEERFSGRLEDKDLLAMRNVAGEIKAAEYAMQFCLDHDIKSLELYHDYEGIAKWCTGEWNANKDGTKNYKHFYESIKDSVNVKFIKVKGHSGDKYNDLADKLAKEALNSDFVVPDHSQILKQDKEHHISQSSSGNNLSKKVYLDRTTLPESINIAGIDLWGEIFNFISFEKLGSQYRYSFCVDGDQQSLDFYFRKDGSVTIVNVGTETQYTDRLKQEIVNRNIEKTTENTNCSFSSVSAESYDQLLDFLDRIEGIDLIEEKKFDAPKHNYLKFKSKFGDSMVINRFENGTILFQGSPAYIMAQAMCFMAQKPEITEDSLNQSQSNLYASPKRSVEEVRSVLRQRLPYAYDKLDDLILKIMSPSISLSLSSPDIEIEDYCCYVFPVLKALEAFLKQLLLNKGIYIDDKKGFGPILDYDENSARHHLKRRYYASIDDSTYIECVEDIYHYFKQSRHSYFHANQFLVMTSMIESKCEADAIISDVLGLIEDTAKKIL